MSGAAIRAGQAFYELMAEDKTAKGIDSAEKRLRAFGARIGMIGTAMTSFSAAGLTAIWAMVKAFAGAGDNLADAMGQTGMGSDFLQTLKLGAADAGVGFDQLLASVNKFQSLLTDAANGSAGAQATLAKLGLTVADLAGLTPDQQFSKMADAISQIQDPAARAAAAIDVFGKSGARMLPMLADGAKGLAKQMADLKARGRLMSVEDLKTAQDAEATFLSLSNGLGRLVELIGAALMLVGGMIAMAGVAIGGLAVGFAAAGAVIGAILSPIGLIVAAIVGCGAAALVSAYYLDQLFNGGAALQFLTDMAKGAWEAMKMLWTAISNGRWDLAGKLITDGLNVAFTGGILSLKTAWVGFADWLMDLMVKLMTSVSKSVVDGMKGMLDSLQPLAERLGGSALGMLIGARAALNVGSGKAEQFAKGLRTAGKAANQFGLGDSQDDAAQALAELAKTMEKIRELPDAAGRVTKDTDWDFGVRAKIQQLLPNESQGFHNSGNARLAGYATPGNPVPLQEQQLREQQDANKILDKILGRLEDADTLVFE